MNEVLFLKGTHTTLDTAPPANRAFSTPDTAPEPNELKPRAAAPPRGAAGEALLVTPGMAARRVTIRAARGGQPSVVTKGDAILVTPVGPAHHGQAGGETLGPITALAIGR